MPNDQIMKTKDAGTRNQVSNQKKSKPVPYYEANAEKSETQVRELCSELSPQITSQEQRKGSPRHLITWAE